MILKVLVLLCSLALVSSGVIGTDSDYSPATSVSYSSISMPTIVKTVTTPVIEKTITTPIGYSKIFQSPPVYESVLTTKESKFETPDGSQHSTFSKSFNTAYSSVNKFESKSFKDGDALANTIPGIYATAVHSPVFYHPRTSITYSSPLGHTINRPIFAKSIPVTYNTHDIPLTKIIASPDITPVVSRTKVIASDLSSYSSPLLHTVSSPTLTKSVSIPVPYTNHDEPLAKTIVSPSLTSYETPVVSKTNVLTSGLSSYSSHTPLIGAQPIKTTLTYSEAPIVSHMSFNGLGASYAW